MTVFRRFLRYVRPYAGQMVVATVTLAGAGALMSAVVAMLRPLVDKVLLAPAEAVSGAEAAGTKLPAWLAERVSLEAWSTWIGQRAMVMVPVLLVSIFLVRGVLLYVGQYLTAKVGASVVRDLRRDLYESVVFQSQAFFRAHTTGVVLSRLLNDIQKIQRVSTAVLADLLRVSAMVPFLLLVVLVHDWRLTIFALIVVPVMAYPVVRLGRRLRKAARRSQEYLGESASLMTETVTGIKVVQSFTMEPHEIDRFRAALGRVFGHDLKAGRAAALSGPILELAAAVAGAVLFVGAGTQIAQAQASPGDFVVVITGLALLFMSVRRLNRVNIEIQQGMAAAERVFQMIDWEREIEEVPDAIELPPDASRLRFENVDFAYGEEQVLHGIDLSLEKGEMVALVGPSGAGKSTVANLVPRFIDPTGGRVTVDGMDIREATLHSLRSLIGLVTQETVVFDDSVANNLLCGRQDLSPERMIEAARAAQAHDFIEDLPEGYDTRLGEGGVRLSAGQRQRIAIARALLKDPPFLILDEATSALDAEAESLFQQALVALLEGRASLVIAHRLATVQMADRILVMNAGRIVEQGTHEALVASGELYARLYRLQFLGEEAAVELPPSAPVG